MAVFIVEKVVDGAILVDLRGRITMGPETEALRNKMKELIEAGRQRIILNLGEVTYMDSTGISTLVSCHTSVCKAGGILKLLHLPRNVQQVLEVYRLIAIFEVYEDLGTAVESFQTATRPAPPPP